MDWPSIVGGVAATVSVANVLLSNRIRGDMAELKLAVTERVVAQDRETRDWVEHRIDKVDARLDSLKASG